MSELAASERLEDGERLVSQATQTEVDVLERREVEGDDSAQVQISASLSEVECLLTVIMCILSM